MGVRVPSFDSTLDEARKRYSRALAVQELLLGPDHPDLAPTLTHLAQVAWEQGRPRAARDLSQRALRILEAAIGPDHPSLAVCRENLTVLGAADSSN